MSYTEYLYLTNYTCMYASVNRKGKKLPRLLDKN